VVTALSIPDLIALKREAGVPRIWKMSDSSKPSRNTSSESAEEPSEGFSRGWGGHEHDQRVAWLRLSYAERLRWLEEAKAFAAARKMGESSDG
jgi:hypothetical protein